MTDSQTLDLDQPAYDLTSVAARLKAFGVESVMVIDDAFDGDPNTAQWKNLSPQTQDDVRTLIEGIPELENWLAEQDLSIPESAMSPEAEHYLEELKLRLDEREELEAIWYGYIEPAIDTGREEVDDLVNRLTELDIDVLASGILDPEDPPANLSVIFIDYNLDDSDAVDVAAKSIAEVNRIYDALEAPNKPIVVLMSGKTTLSPELKLKFREETQIMAGMFFGYQKDELKGNSLYVILYDIAENWPSAVALQSFTHNVSEASQTAANKVSDLVNGLTLEDFALIQRLSLNADGHPLGEYLLWLTGVYFKQQLGRSDAVQQSKESVDRMVFAASPMADEWGPSDSFRLAYRAAVFTDAGPDISAVQYPSLGVKAKQQSGDPSNIVSLHFGDLFIQDEVTSPMAYVVVTPECDLVFGGPRPFPKDRSVILVPGEMKVEEPFKVSSENAARTELLNWNNKDWRIEWRVKEAESVKLGGFKKWAENLGVSRVARIEFSFAADIQRAYTSNLSRVGLPVVPPQFQSKDATVYVVDGSKKLRQVCGPIHNGAYLFSSPQFTERKCILTRPLIMELQAGLTKASTLAAELPTEQELGRIPNPDDQARRLEAATERVEKNKADLWKFLAYPESIVDLKGPHDLTGSPEEVVLDNVAITNEANISRYHAKTVLIINLQEPDAT